MKTATLPITQRPRFTCRVRSRAKRPAGVRIKNILVPIDFSERSLEVLTFARSIAQQFGAALHLAHVYEPDYPLVTVMAMPIALPPIQVAQGVRRHLKDVAKQSGLELRPGCTHASEGRPFLEICRIAREQHIDLIILATRGITGLKHLLLGSTAERVVRYSPCPVLVVHPREKNEKREFRIKRIVVPIDFSEGSLKGLEYARRLAGQYEAELLLLNSVALQYYVTNDEYARYDLPLLMQQAEKASRRQMRDLVQATDWKGIKVKPSLQIGHAGQQICAEAARGDADLIVTSTHGTTGFKHILLGSTAEYVVRHAKCPVLVVPSHARPVVN